MSDYDTGRRAQAKLTEITKKEEELKNQKGKKFDNNKPQISLIPTDALNEMAKAFSYGAKKYGPHNYRDGIQMSRLLDAAYRHIGAFKEGENLDPESGYTHLGHALASLAMATFMYYHRRDLDDRWQPVVSIDQSKTETTSVDVHYFDETRQKLETLTIEALRTTKD